MYTTEHTVQNTHKMKAKKKRDTIQHNKVIRKIQSKTT